MSLNVFLAFCIIGVGFMIYALFQWTYGDRRSALGRQFAARKDALMNQSPGLSSCLHKKPPTDPKDQP